MAAEFGLGGYEPGQLKEIFDLLRGLRLTNGDFVPENPGEPGDPGDRGEPGEPGEPRDPRDPGAP
jgi:hypothetical protein